MTAASEAVADSEGTYPDQGRALLQRRLCLRWLCSRQCDGRLYTLRKHQSLERNCDSLPLSL